jgi:hypothetical protein
MFTKEQRVDLIFKDNGFPEWAWVYDKSEICGSAFEEQLIKDAKADGYNIQFVILIGPDNWDEADPDQRSWVSTECIISDAARAATWCDADGKPWRTRGYTMWQKVGLVTGSLESEEENAACSRNVIRSLSTTKGQHKHMEISPSSSNASIASSDSSDSGREASCLSLDGEFASRIWLAGDDDETDPHLVADDIDSDLDPINPLTFKAKSTIWESHLQDDPEVRARFVSKRRYNCWSLTASRDSEVSSTNINQIIHDSAGDDRREQLKDLVLSPDLLLEYLDKIEAKHKTRNRVHTDSSHESKGLMWNSMNLGQPFRQGSIRETFA